MVKSVAESARKAILAGGAGVTAIACGALAWGISEARWPQLRYYELPLLPHGAKPVRILHVSDLHLTPQRQWLVEFVHRCLEQKPDLVFSTGDNFSDLHALEAIKSAYEPLLNLPGAFVFGSNDYYSPRPKLPLSYLIRGVKPPRRERDLPAQQLREFLAQSWLDLNNHADTLHLPQPAANALVIEMIGVDDPHIKQDRMPASPKDWERADLRIGLAHAPYSRVLDAFSDRGCDLALAGHTHGGQVCVPGVGPLVTNCDLPPHLAGGLFYWPQLPQDQRKRHCLPLNIADAVRANPPSPAEQNRMPVHVSRGLGTNKFTPIRFACRPEASMLILTARNTTD